MSSIAQGIEFGTYHEIIVYELRAATRRYFDYWEGVLDKPESERPMFASSLEQHRFPIVILSCTLLESVINFYLCTKCNAEEFDQIERGTLKKKWQEAPKKFIPSYCIPPSSGMEEELRKLIQRRHTIIHCKPTMSINGDGRHTGNEPPVAWDEHDFVKSCTTLPLRLMENIFRFDTDCFVALNDVFTYCGAAASEFEKQQNRLDVVVAKLPPDLIREIMQQGHDRRTAVRCVLLMGEPPKINEAGNIVVQLSHLKQIILKPLKYFAAKTMPAIDTQV